MNKETPRKAAVFFTLAILLTVSSLSYVPSAAAATAITSLLPTSGHVGDTITVTGTIDTINGTFTIRWDGAINVTSGKAVNDFVNTSFVIPATTALLSGRNITVELIDNNASSVDSKFFTLYTQFLMQMDKPSPPKQFQEGNTTNIRVNVTGGTPNTIYAANVTVRNPANQTHQAIVPLSNTTSTGSGGTIKTYPNNFSAHTNLTGTYFVAFNGTLAAAQFIVGLTDRTEYQRSENVRVQAAGYKPSEKVKADIRTVDSVSGFPQNVTASSSGLITLTWKVPVNATPGTYHIALANTTVNGTAKAPNDAQDFTILGVACLVQAKNLAHESVEGASIEVYNASATTSALNKGNTNSTGWIRFNLDEGNYTLKAFFKSVQVGLQANELIKADTQLHMNLSLVNFLATIRTEEGEGVPLINVTLKENKTGTQTAAGQTNATGMAAMRNLFTNKTYRIEATRYSLLFSNETVTVEPSPALGWISHALTLPNHSLSVHAIDSEDSDAAGIGVKVYEWASGIGISVDSATTNSSGNVFFSLPFGRYILRAFKGDYLLSETAVDLTEPTTLTFDLVTLNVNVIVSVLDYFGQPVANAEVKIERMTGQDFALISTQVTNSAGTAQFAQIVGGDSRVSVYVGGKLVALRTQFLGAGSNDVALKVAEYVAVLGYPIPAGAFALIAFVLALIVVVLVAARKRIMQVFRKPLK